MKKETLLDVLGDVSDELVEDAAMEAVPAQRGLYRHRWAAAAACLAVVVIGVLAAGHFGGGTPDSGSPCVTQEAGIGVTIPPAELQLSKNAGEGADMLGFFIYGGRSYVQYENIDGHYADRIIGERLGRATGLIDEWTPQEGYVELAGSVSGDFYAVQGFDPGYMLCMRCPNGDVALYVNDNGMTLQYGEELYEDRLHLTENFAGLTYETHDSWNWSRGELLTLSPGHESAVRDFIAALDAGEFLPREAIPEEDGLSIYETLETYHVYFQALSGVPVHLRLLDGGYVIFSGLYQVCVQVDQGAYDAFVSLLDTAGIPAEQDGVTDFDKCAADPVFGPYMPQIAPDEYAFIRYDIDPETAEITGTREIELGYSADGGSYYLNFLHPEDSITGDPLLSLDELTLEAIESISVPAASETDVTHIRFGIRVDGIVVTFHGYGVTAGTALQVMRDLVG